MFELCVAIGGWLSASSADGQMYRARRERQFEAGLGGG
jgi:hypothetical protein